MKKVLLFLAAVLVVSTPTALVLTYLINRKSDRIVWQSCQPDDIKYGSYDPYCLSVIEGSVNWLSFGPTQRYYLFIGRGQDAPSYGVHLDYSLPESDEYIQASKVEWSKEGLTFVEKSGVRLFLPKARFIGGR